MVEVHVGGTLLVAIRVDFRLELAAEERQIPMLSQSKTQALQ